MHHARKLGLATVFAASATLALFGCKKETFQTPGADLEELSREGKLAPPTEAQKEQAAAEPAKKSTTFSTPGENLGEAKGKGLVPEGTGGGPKDDTARPSRKTAPPSQEKKDKDGTLETPGADEKEVNDEDIRTSPLGKP
jgi:hypothetical protein